MIDTNKYKGHSLAPWSYTLETEDKIWDERGAVWDKDKNCLALVDDGSEQFPDADLMLIADAPLLLAEVMRLREGIVNALIPTDKNPIIHPLTPLSDLRDAIKELIA